MATGGRLQQWWLNRLPVTDKLTLGHRNLYILPTRAGWMLGLTLIVLLLGSINYMLNLGYMLTFLLGGVSVVAMHLTHNNLRGLQITAQPGAAVFAGQPALVQVTLHNPSRTDRFALQLRALSTAAPEHWADAPAASPARLSLEQATTRRGRHALAPFVVESRFPLGTFRAWAWCRPAGLQWVYPTPEVDCPPLPGAQHHTETGNSGQSAAGDLADELRAYRQGDPLKRVVWKKVAKIDSANTDGWVSREQPLEQSGELWLKFDHCGLSDTEGRLSRLCAWVLEAERRQLRYGLELPHTSLAPSVGLQHQTSCLEALALC